MKKLLVIIAVVALFAAPAAAVDWNFYGSARMATFYTSDDFGDFENAQGSDDDDGLRWQMQGNSRLGARVKGETVAGRVELSTFGRDGDDSAVGTRLLYGDWNFGAGSLRVGKSYSPTSQFISTQAFDGDLGLLGIGTFYGRRPAGLTLSFGGLRVALLDPETLDIANTAGVATGGDVDSYLPKVEVGWGMAFDAFNFNLMGGYQMYTIEDVTPLAGGGTDDVDVISWVVGADAGFSFGPAYVKGAVSLSQNPSQYNALVYAYPAAAVWDGDDDTDDTDLIQAALVAGFRMSDMVAFEVGGGIADYDTDCAGCDDTNPWAVYGNATVQLAPGVWIIPEAGYFDFDNAPVDISDNDAGSSFYIGAKWQLDF
jgi:hypothetical protein